MPASPLTTAFAGRRVLVTGHTGFKGAWLCEWLLGMGADVWGFALAPPTNPSLFEQLGLAARMHHKVADVRDALAVQQAIDTAQPDYVFHLAAQSLVRESYRHPLETFATNALGTVNVLEAARQIDRRCVVIVVTTDKCYLNREWFYGYRENDALGGRDPYSASKAAAEIATSAWRSSFFCTSPVRIASARAGNVIGGGDWAKDRILPDCIRALAEGRPIPIRNQNSTRPWQHVLEPLAGYLWLAASLDASAVRVDGDSSLESGFNFGPDASSNRSVAQLVDCVLNHWPGAWIDTSNGTAPHEARLLHLSTDKATQLLGWRPVWAFEETIRRTVAWYRNATEAPGSIGASTRSDIAAYVDAAAKAQQPWASGCVV